ncbi:hypothetical protein DL764_007013 [Monosporascus ibericus]|uniref:Uncharacterized protein n=1 Tax=Monosporascus ibericus TaxID=155417 RepID=A0A4Q4T3K9_9PEZI|nr:hypothetical protein DL764_007013 [Monosporascus ibericus]
MVGCQKYTDDQINFILDRHFSGMPHPQIKDEFLEHFNFPSYSVKRVQYVVEHYGRNPKYGNRTINKVRNSKAPSTVSPSPREAKLDQQKPAGGTDTPRRGPARPGRQARSAQPVQRSPQPNTIVCLSCNGTGFVTVMPPFSLNEPDDDHTSRLVRDFLTFQPPGTSQPTDPYSAIDPALIAHQPTVPLAAYTPGNVSPPPLHHGLAPLRSGLEGLQDNSDWAGMTYPPSSTGYYEAPSFDAATSYTGVPTAPPDPLALLNTRTPNLPELPATPYIQQPPPLVPLKRRRDTSPSPSYSLSAAVDHTRLPTSAPGQPYGYHTPVSDFHYGAAVDSSDFHYGTVDSSVPGPEILTLAPGTPSSSQRRTAKRPRVSASNERAWIPASKRPRVPASIPPSPSSAEASTAAAGTPRWTPAFPRAAPIAGGEWTDTKTEEFAGTVELPSLPPPAATGTGRLPHYGDQILYSIEEDPEQAAPPIPVFYGSNNQSPPPPAPGNDEAGCDAASGEGQWPFSGLSEPPGTPSRVLDEWRAQASPREH